MKYREEAKRGYGPCSSVQWSSPQSIDENGKEAILLVAGFGNGRIASYVLKDDEFYPVGILDIGSPVSVIFY